MNWWKVSADGHIVEPAEVFAGLAERFGPAAPRIVDRAGTEQWVAGEDRYIPVHFPDRAGDRFQPGGSRPPRSGMAAVRRGAVDPAAFLDDNEIDGVWASVVFPSHVLGFYSLRGAEVTSAVLRRYNDWIVDFGSHDRDRIAVVAALNVEDVDESVSEMERLRAAGAVGAVIPVCPPEGTSYADAAYEPLWAAAAASDVPLHLHIATDSNPRGLQKLAGTQVLYNADRDLRRAISDMIFSGVFSRHPSLRLATVEHEGAWISYFIDRMDWHYTNNMQFKEYPRFPEGSLPSDVFRRHFHIGFIEDRHLFKNTCGFDDGHFLWGNDFPHSESSYPRSDPLLEIALDGLDDTRRKMVTQENACRFYSLPLPPASAPHAGRGA